MPLSIAMPAALSTSLTTSLPASPPFSAAAAPSTPLGPFADSAVAWSTWVTLMGFVGLAALALLIAVPAAARAAPGATGPVTTRLARAAVVLGVLAVPAVLTDLAHDASASDGYDYSAAWNSLYDGSNAGRLSGIEVTLILVGVALLAPLTARPLAARRMGGWLLGGGLAAATVALGTTRFPDQVPADWGRSIFQTLMWMLHLIGGAVWLGGLFGLVLLALPGVLPATAERGAFWSLTLRRFSAWAMGCVAAIALSGLFLYWQHVDGPSQLLSTMYGRVLGVKIIIFGALLLLGMYNQFWLHPRIDALRAAGEERPLATVLLRRFPLVVATEVLLGLALLFVAPFLHGSARNQAYQANLAEHSVTAVDAKTLPKLPPKTATASTWVWGSAETVAVVAVMVGGYRVSGRLARRRRTAAASTGAAPVLPATS